MFFWCLSFSPKNEQKQFDSRYHSIVKSNFFGCSLGEMKIPKRCFEIHWPLLTNSFSSVFQSIWTLMKSFWNSNNVWQWLKPRSVKDYKLQSHLSLITVEKVTFWQEINCRYKIAFIFAKLANSISYSWLHFWLFLKKKSIP